MKVLIVEDDDNSRHLLEVILSSKGYEIASLTNGKKALDYLKGRPVDMIVSDIMMPEMDGFELCRAVKGDNTLKNIIFVFYTATYTSMEDERFALSLGADRFLVKPMPTGELLEVLDDLLDTKPSAPASGISARLDPQELDRQYAGIIRAKLDKKIRELNQERQRLMDSEARFRDFAEASANWFWETDRNLMILDTTEKPEGFNFHVLTELTEICHSHTPAEMLLTLRERKQFSDCIVHFSKQNGKSTYLRISGKPVFDSAGIFTGYRGVGSDVTETIELNRRVEFLALHDELTGLPNRTLFRERLEHVIAKAELTKKQVLLLFLDLDHFKMVNDTLGHEAGDQLLIMASKRIQERVWATDTLCRIGGDEFVLIMDGASPQDTHRLVRDIIAAFAQPFEINEQKIYCSISIGVSVYPDDTTDPQTLLAFADMAMYRAKQNGRNSFEFYTSNMNQIAHQWLELEHGLRLALSQPDQLFLAYQPQLDGSSNKLVGMEALLRWRHPQRGLIPPGEFIKVAEQSSLINQIGDWVIDTACGQIKSWQDKKLNVPRVSINISARHLRSTGLQKSLEEIPARHGIQPRMLCIEITEHALLEETDIVKQNMEFISKEGFAISLDDFGMGHSSLLYLKKWSVNEVKIDRSFIDGIITSEEDKLIVKAIVALADALGLELMAEGVENPAQANILLASGCHKMQGYHFSVPLTADKLESWLGS